MLSNVFSDWKDPLKWYRRLEIVETSHPWIKCFKEPTPSHVLEEVCLKELGEDVYVPTE
jgi:hypothetical protein